MRVLFFFFQAEDGIRDLTVTGVQTCALPILARELGQALHRPWEGTHRPVTPQQVRRVMPAILLQVGTPARPCQPRGISPGRAKGFRPKPAPRFPVVRKTLKVPLKASG